MSSFAICSISSSVNAKSKISILSLICSAFLLPGITTNPIWVCQRRITCAGVFPYFLPSPANTNSFINAVSPCPSGYQLISLIPYLSKVTRSSFCVKYGCASTWINWGTISHFVSNSSIYFPSKFEIPMDFALPSLYAFSSILYPASQLPAGWCI